MTVSGGPEGWHETLPARKWQVEALARWRSNGRRGVTAVVTGGGKTYFALQCMLDACRARPNIRTIIVVPTIALLDQWYVSLQDDLGADPGEISLYSGENKAKAPGRINVMVINTARTRIQDVMAKAPTFLIVDECHRAASEVNSLALTGDHLMTLGLSATPERDYDDLFLEVIEPALGPIIYEYDYNQALRDGVIAPFELANVRISLTESEELAYSKLTRRIVPLFKRRQKGEAVDDQLQRLLIMRARVSTAARNRYPATIKLLDRHRRERAIVFHEQIEAAEILASMLKAGGHRVAAYHSRLGPSLRQDNLRMFRRGEVDVLVTCRALDEGINVPDASVAIITASTASTRQRIQRLGRVLRPAPGKAMANIYTVYATEQEAERLKLEATRLEGADSIRWIKMRGA
jgi:superfamily II DNA or RNA helicase